jgi:DNA repair exonuclease SbcCD ATPase subunit
VDKAISEFNTKIDEVKQKLREIDREIPRVKKSLDEKSEQIARIKSDSKEFSNRLERLKREAHIPQSTIFKELQPSIASNLSRIEVNLKNLQSSRQALEEFILVLQYINKRSELGAKTKETSELKQRLEKAKSNLDNLLSYIKDLRRSESSARLAEMDTIKEFTRRYEFAISSNYKRLDPHPLFKNLKIRTETTKQGGEIYFEAQYRNISANVHSVLSQAQQNSVALCLFLTFNLAKKDQSNPIMLDDPVQSMDEVNILALVDLLKIIHKDRQIIVATHNEAFFALLAERLRPSNPEESQLRHVIRSFLEDGPEIQTTTIPYQSLPIDVAQYL